jgi:4-carboxymuconolactone decarboxylase
MDKERFESGLARRREVLGEEYVERSLANASEFTEDFQALITEYCWGVCWADDTLSPRERSILNLGMIAALGRMNEFELHFGGALRNGLSEKELRAILTQIAVYCGIPAGLESFKVGRPGPRIGTCRHGLIRHGTYSARRPTCRRADPARHRFRCLR